MKVVNERPIRAVARLRGITEVMNLVEDYVLTVMDPYVLGKEVLVCKSDYAGDRSMIIVGCAISSVKESEECYCVLTSELENALTSPMCVRDGDMLHIGIRYKGYMDRRLGYQYFSPVLTPNSEYVRAKIIVDNSILSRRLPESWHVVDTMKWLNINI